ncbi:hypothetical protein B0H67DRAFT_566288 [Lasiosphaeris hirsuta]|uniref:RING-type domain-containing protein n=1 Tax=Lasiosphaeris hirsuta TaxID=260670 RepID=A0AA40BCY5_9PEZI|nr:hypothetical protein B0H67DRAFT_566288 [Lasiosphaeris hirsuta]
MSLLFNQRTSLSSAFSKASLLALLIHKYISRTFECHPPSSMEQELTCAICQCIFFDPVKLLDCQHIFCGSCIKPWLENPNTACPQCRTVPRAATSDRLLSNLVNGFLADNPNKALSDADKTNRRQEYSPGMDISPLVPFMLDTPQIPGPRTLVPNPLHVMTPEPDEEVPEISRGSWPARYRTAPPRPPASTCSEIEIAPHGPARATSSMLERLLYDLPPRARLPGNYDSPAYGSPQTRAPQVAHTINNYYYQAPVHSQAPASPHIFQQHFQSGSSPYGVIVNGAPLDTYQYNQLISTGVAVQPGNYWYDNRSGLYGYQGGPGIGQILPGLNLGGPLASNASGYSNTNIYINGREIHAMDLASLHRWGYFPPSGKRYWLDADGSYGQEGMPHVREGNLSINSAAILASYLIARPAATGCIIL